MFLFAMMMRRMSTSMSEGASSGLLGILGGTFDPIHNLHLQLADAARKACGFSELRWIPAGQPPHRAQPLATVEHRLAMLRLAIDGREGETVDTSELISTSKSYTVLTLERLRREFGPSRPIAIVLGADAFIGLPSWYRFNDIFALSHVAVTQRPGHTLFDALPSSLSAEWEKRLVSDVDLLKRSPSGHIFVFPMAEDPLSATDVRSRIRARESVTNLLPESVVGYIRQHSLYSA